MSLSTAKLRTRTGTVDSNTSNADIVNSKTAHTSSVGNKTSHAGTVDNKTMYTRGHMQFPERQQVKTSHTCGLSLQFTLAHSNGSARCDSFNHGPP